MSLKTIHWQTNYQLLLHIKYMVLICYFPHMSFLQQPLLKNNKPISHTYWTSWVKKQYTNYTNIIATLSCSTTIRNYTLIYLSAFKFWLILPWLGACSDAPLLTNNVTGYRRIIMGWMRSSHTFFNCGGRRRMVSTVLPTLTYAS